jgi:hypothetical protein
MKPHEPKNRDKTRVKKKGDKKNQTEKGEKAIKKLSRKKK